MAKAEIKTEISIKGISAVGNLVELIAKYQDDLPLELQNSLKEVAEYGLGDFTADDYWEKYGNKKISKAIFNNYNLNEFENILSINKILKKVVIIDKKKKIQKDIYPKSFQLYVDDELIIGW